MRGQDQSSGSLFGYVDLEERVPVDHPLRMIRCIVNEVLSGLSCEFEKLYSHTGRRSIPPEQLLRALLLQAFYSIRSERQLMEQLDFNMLFRWFVGLGLDDTVWDASTFCHNRDRLLEAEVSAKLLTGVVEHPKVRRLLSRDHFSVDGTLIEAWASMKSFRPKDGGDGDAGCGRNGERDFHGETRSNATHESTTDPQARLYRKGAGRESKLCYMGHALMENRNGLVVGGTLTQASGTAEREAALAMIARHRPGRRRKRDIGSANAAASASKRCSAGSRAAPGRPRPSSEDATGWLPSSPWRWSPTTSCDCPGCWRRPRHEARSGVRCGRQMADRRGRYMGSRPSRSRRTGAHHVPRRRSWRNLTTMAPRRS